MGCQWAINSLFIVIVPNLLPKVLQFFYWQTFTKYLKLLQVRVPEWISQTTTSRLQVRFSPQAENQLSSLETEENMTHVITDILREDPRSVYLRDRYANQFYTFLINNFHVSCKFDDNNRSVKVFRVVAAGSVCECGQPEWQCSVHSGPMETWTLFYIHIM